VLKGRGEREDGEREGEGKGIVPPLFWPMLRPGGRLLYGELVKLA